MLLRGDPPKGEEVFTPPRNGFNYASELIQYVEENYDYCKAAAAYVEKHPEAPSLEEDIKHLKTKVSAGADFLITQLFFINQYYFDFVERVRAAGINCRIIPGIIPLTSYHQIARFTQMSSAEIPEALSSEIEANRDNKEKMYEIGLEYTIDQCRELLAKGAPGLHFYTLNKSRAAVEIFESL